MSVFVLIVLAVLGSTMWVVLNRPVARRADRNDRVSAGLLAASALALTVGLVYGLDGVL